MLWLYLVEERSTSVKCAGPTVDQVNLLLYSAVSCPVVLTGMSVYVDLSNYLFTCHQVSFTHFPLWPLTLENGPSDAQRGPGLVKGSPVEGLLVWWKKVCS